MDGKERSKATAPRVLARLLFTRSTSISHTKPASKGSGFRSGSGIPVQEIPNPACGKSRPTSRELKPANRKRGIPKQEIPKPANEGCVLLVVRSALREGGGCR